jgi:putative membrane protein
VKARLYCAMNSPVKAELSARPPWLLLVAMSACIAAFLLWLIYFHPIGTQPGWLHVMPVVNCVFNSISAVCLVLGYRAIKRRDWRVHKRFMLTAASSSAAFLVTYVAYHYMHGDTIFDRSSAIRPFYLGILASHIILSIVSLPMILATLYLALSRSFVQHKRIAKVTLPIWLYVSVTGVVVFLLLRFFG